MGNANEICTDKTGTLTENRMSVQAAYLEGEIMENEVNTRLMSLTSTIDIQQSVIYNSTAYIDPKDDQTKGNVTEVGLIKHLTGSGVDTKAHIAARKLAEDNKLFMLEIPFSSKRKRATIAVSMDNGERIRVFCKGAPEVVIEKCEN
jgi:Ca2+-transporting ATPase